MKISTLAKASIDRGKDNRVDGFRFSYNYVTFVLVTHEGSIFNTNQILGSICEHNELIDAV